MKRNTNRISQWFDLVAKRKKLTMKYKQTLPLSIIAALLLLISFAPANGTSLSLGEFGSYSVSGDTVVLQADEILNNETGGTSGTIRLELWAFSSPYSGSSSGYKLASYYLGQPASGIFLC
jgi:hypothetical protein